MFPTFVSKNFLDLSEISWIVMLYGTSIDTKFFLYLKTSLYCTGYRSLEVWWNLFWKDKGKDTTPLTGKLLIIYFTAQLHLSSARLKPWIHLSKHKSAPHRTKFTRCASVDSINDLSHTLQTCSCAAWTRSDHYQLIKVSIIMCVLSDESLFAISIVSVRHYNKWVHWHSVFCALENNSTMYSLGKNVNVTGLYLNI